MRVTLAEITDATLNGTRATRPFLLVYLPVLAVLGLGACALFLIWLYQILTGMGVAGIHDPVDWGAYIGNFVFWVGIAHSGTLISAILFLVRSRWRDAVSRATEAMTVFAVMTAGLFPLVHLGRVWVFYFILPYPSERQIWPNFISPLVWDVLAVSTYFTVSLIFFLVGLIPDAAAARDWAEETYGRNHLKTKLYRTMALGWSGTINQWRHYSRSYLYFAALATPLVISVHSIVSWDFAMGLPIGWHTTIYAPYFVAGAIHSGLAMALTLIIPMRRILGLERVIQSHHIQMIARTMIVTTLILGYAYLIDPFMGWYSGERIDRQFIDWRATSAWMTWIYWMVMFFNAVVPLTLAIPKLRRRLGYLFVISIIVNIGMWSERIMLVTTSLSFDFLPHTWSTYALSPVEIGITVGSFCFFFFLYFVFAKTLPTVPIADMKSQQIEARAEDALEEAEPPSVLQADLNKPGLLAVYPGTASMVRAVESLLERGHRRIEVFSPTKLPPLLEAIGEGRSPVRYWTFAGALAGMIGGFWLAGGTALVNNLIVGGKWPISPIPYCIPAFEGTILIGSFFNLGSLLYYSRLSTRQTAPRYRRSFSRDRYGIFVESAPPHDQEIRQILQETGPEEIHAET